MSANICEVSKIQDEDVLRKMWQETEDFGRKKEIRAHMYKVREARLKDLYSSSTEAQTQVSVHKSSSKSSNVQTTHADSLADHSFASLKSKEVRDSTSPTADVAFNNKINATEQYGNSGWTTASSEDTSKDGRLHTSSRTATTSGTEKIDKGVRQYAAKAEQRASVYQDGDANNYTKAVGMSDSSTIRQEASGGDEFSSFKSSAITSKSSSKSVTESKSQSGGDTVDYSSGPKDICRTGDQTAPANAKTVVFTETKTLPDGSRVTTTRYETVGGSSKTTKSSSQSRQTASTSTEQKSSSSSSTGQQQGQQLKTIVDSGVDTVDYKKAVRLSEDLSKSVNVSDHTSKSSASSKTVQQEVAIKDTKHSEAMSSTKQDSKLLETSRIQTQEDICEVKTPAAIEPARKEPVQEQPRREPEPAKPYEQPERREPIKPSKAELEVSTKATAGQYDTTYRSEFTNKKIHVEVSATHDAFARSLRALTPEDLKQSSTRSVRSSNASLRGSQSPEKMRHPSRVSPERLYSPKKSTATKYSPDRVTSYNSDTITRRKKVSDDSATYRSSTLSRESASKEHVKSRSRSTSPATTITGDFEYSRRKSAQVTDLDEEHTSTTTRTKKTVSGTGDSRPSTLNYSKRSKKITERSPTSPLADLVPSKRTPSPSKEVTAATVRRTSVKEEQQQQQRHEKILRRSDTYEERCRQILGIPEKKKPERSDSIVSSDRKPYRTASRDRITAEEISSARKPSLPDAARRPSKSPEKCAVNGFSDGKSAQIAEFPSQIRRSPERKPLDQYPGRKSPTKDRPKISEFPSQIGKSPAKQPLEKYPERKSPTKDAPKISEFPSQIRRSSEREPLPSYPEGQAPVREAPKIGEFPPQVRRSPEREPLPEYPGKKAPSKEGPMISEFPSQVRKTPEREPLPEYPEKPREAKEPPKIAEFPSQIRKTPEREPLPEYPEKPKEAKESPKIAEFPSQIRKTPEREPLREYPEKPREAKESSKVSEFRKSSDRETVSSSTTDNIVTTAEEVTTKKQSKKLSEFPSQAPKKTPKPTAEDKVLQETADYLYKDKIPVDEPLFTKKFIAELGSDDECEITVDEHGNTKINTIDDEELYLQEMQHVTHKTVKKDSPERQFVREKLSQERHDASIKQQIDDFILSEKNEIYRATESRKSSPDLRRSPERGILKHTSQFDEKAEKTLRAETSTRKTAQEKFNATQTIVGTSKVEIVKSKAKSPPTHVTTKRQLVRDSSDLKINTSTVKATTKDVKAKSVSSTSPSTRSVPLRKPELPSTPTKCAKTCCDIKLETITKSSATDSKVTRKFIQKPEPTDAPKRHVVTTTIHVSPKTVKETRAIKTITNTQTVQTRPKLPEKVLKPVTATTRKLDVENIEQTDRLTQKKRIDKMTRTAGDQIDKSPYKAPTRVSSKPEVIRKAEDVKDKKCITTKTILIDNTVADEREIIVDLLRSTSTRDDRNTVCPTPVRNNGVKGAPRYPDQVTEPDDFTSRHAPRKLPTKPIDECEDVSDFTAVTAVTTEQVIDEEDTAQETADESVLSVNEMVSKFTQSKDMSKKVGPAPKLDRPILIIDEKLEADECLLSVSEKVTKFVNKERLSVSGTSERPKSPRCQNIVDITDIDENDESLMSVSDKVTHFVTTAENVKRPQTSTIKVEKTDLSAIEESIRTDECLRSVSDKVSKFITTAENLATKKDDGTIARQPATATKRPSKDLTDTEECVTIATEEQTYTRTSPQRQITPSLDRTSPTRHTRIKEERRNSRKDSASTLTRKDVEIETTPKTSRPAKPSLPGSILLRSTESIRKAKALFENMATSTETRETKRQQDILTRPSVFDAKRKPETITVRRLTPDRDDVKLRDIGIKENATSKTAPTADTRRKLSFPSSEEDTKTLLDRTRAAELEDLDVPGYMKPLDRSLRPHSPHRASVTDIEETISRSTMRRSTTPEVVPTATAPANKFGVTLRRTDSGKNFTSTISSAATTATAVTTERKRGLGSILKNHEIEEIYELDVLEELLETTVGYDLRRRIRAQIRLVRSLISEDKLKIVNLKSSKVGSSRRGDAPEAKVYPKKSPTREAPDSRTYTRKPSETNFTEYQTKYIRKSTSANREIDHQLHEHASLVDSKAINEKTTEYQSSYSRKSSASKTYGNTESKPNTRTKSPAKSRETSPETKPRRRDTSSPEKSTCKYFRTDLKKISSSTKSTKDDKPDWITNRTLRKTAETPSPAAKRYSTSSSSSAKTTVTKETKSTKPTDVITSSYGVGPMDENGSPLFGLKALRTQGKMDQSKVQGTVVRSEFYSENGQEPVGAISVTKYSTDPADLSSDEEVTRADGVLSKTTTQKFGYKGTPSYKSVTDKKFSEIESENRTKKSSTKVTRRGSVKEMTQKFLDNTVDTLKGERQSYPKAGLILRTSSFKDQGGSSSTEESPTEERSAMSTVTTVRTSSSKTTSGGQTTSQKGQTFLTNKSKVTGMQDIVSRMEESNKETREGDSAEDSEARSLLNKFLGSQVILSGLEGCSAQAASKTSSTRKATTKVTTTITEGDKPRTVTRTFTHPIAAEDIADIWDEETLRFLLEQSSEYDERRIIRAKLKVVMAEKEVCASLVEDGNPDSSTSTSHSGSASNMSANGQQIQESCESTKQSLTDGPVTTTPVSATRVLSQQQAAKKPMSPFAKFKQLDRANSLNTPPSTPKTPAGGEGGAMFKFTDPQLSRSASTIKERLLHWCQMKTKEYENIQLNNFSGSWADGLAFCALIHHFLPDAFDYSKLTPNNRRYNFTLAFQIADEKADIAPLLDVEDMVATRRPDWKCVFTYVQSIYRRFKDED